MNKLVLLATTVIFTGLSGCAHQAMRGSIAMKTGENEAHVCLGKGEVKAGDRVAVYRNVCVAKGGGTRTSGPAGSCEKKEVGMGSVLEVLNDHYSVVKFDAGVQPEEGLVVEKK